MHTYHWKPLAIMELFVMCCWGMKAEVAGVEEKLQAGRIGFSFRGMAVLTIGQKLDLRLTLL